jgi:putative heme transporter
MSASRREGPAVTSAPVMPARADMGESEPRARPWLLRHWQLPVVVIMIVVAYFTLRGHLPSLHAIAEAVRSADIRWILVAVVCEAASLAMFARQQRALLRAVGVRMSMPRAIAVTYARSALAISMPAGSAVSAGFAFQQYRRSGASNDKAAAVMVLSGVVSFLGLGVLYTVGVAALLAAEPSETFANHPILIYLLGGAAVLGIAGWLLLRRRTKRIHARELEPVPAGDGWLRRIRTTARQAIAAWRSLRARDWLSAGSFAVSNWLLDLLCLISVAHAFRLPVGIFTIATMYLGVQIVRQLPITPGGIGLIETGLLAGLTHAGAATAAAAAVVLTYRVLSCWLIIPLGGIAWLSLRARPAPAVALEIGEQSPAEQIGQVGQ